VSSHSAGSTGQLRWRLVAAALTVVAVVCLLMWGARSAPGSDASPSTAPTATAATDATATEAVVTQAAEPAPAAAVTSALPVSLSIPGIDVQTRLTKLGLQEDGSVEVPTNADLAGWYQKGPVPGAHGSSVILGHVDSTSGPAVFYRLRELQPGDPLEVRLDDGTTVSFEVHSIATYANEDFPAQKVYGRTGRPELNLVTCGGDYDSANGGYQSNVVVNARRV
jgi:sortase (surface protein transpeptidase)